MIHKFISNDNQGNVNTLEIGSDYTKISKVVDPVNDDDVVNKKYVDQAGGKFIVTLTPTALDYSGTMDKTANEITAAYEAGQEIVFNVVGFPGFDHAYIPAAWCTYATDTPRCSACATVVDVSSGTQIIIFTSDAYNGAIYYTSVYSLTPAS